MHVLAQQCVHVHLKNLENYFALSFKQIAFCWKVQNKVIKYGDFEANWV